MLTLGESASTAIGSLTYAWNCCGSDSPRGCGARSASAMNGLVGDRAGDTDDGEHVGSDLGDAVGDGDIGDGDSDRGDCDGDRDGDGDGVGENSNACVGPAGDMRSSGGVAAGSDVTVSDTTGSPCDDKGIDRMDRNSARRDI